jgi:hypothetical protein
MTARLFHLERHEDQTGTSGTGTVAEGVEFADGTTVIRWCCPPAPSTCVYASIQELLAIHGHGDATDVVWADPAPAPAGAPTSDESLGDELRRLRALTDPDLSIQDLEQHLRDGRLDLRVVTGPDGGHPATRFLAAVMLNAALGEDGTEPPNYRETTIEFDLRPAGEIDHYRASLEVIKPGGRSSHEIRQDLEAQLRSLTSP